MIDVRLLATALEDDACLRFVASDADGGTVLFKGTIRNQTAGKSVLRLTFEAYEAMAVREMEKIAAAGLEKWQCHRVAIHHRTGTLLPGDTAVLIAVAAPHRQAAFECCQFCIDTLKLRVPIWKKEVFADGEVWVAAHP
jgi:molybdopterin synthase catalytic subunit